MIVRDEFKYTKTHEWCKLEADGRTVTVGITDYAQELLGELVFIELPEMNRLIKQGQEVCVVESVKSASDIYAPVTGVICSLNSELEKTPELINEKAMTLGWLFKVKVDDIKELTALLTHNDYQKIHCTQTV